MQARKIPRAQFCAASTSAALTAACEAEREVLDETAGRRLLRLWWFIKCSDDAWWEGGFRERREERFAGRAQCRLPCCAGERLQRTDDIAK